MGGPVSEERGVDTVLSDMMAPMSGIRDRDIQASLDLVSAALEFAKGTLKSARQVSVDGEVERPDREDGGVPSKGKGRKEYPGGSLV
jgi:23S rRNA (uridine2552-2'-O)-methyltransferase